MTSNDAQVIGVLGLGRMGSVLARHVAGAGFSVQAYDPAFPGSGSTREGVSLRSSEPAAIVGADIVLVVVGYDEEVKEILLSRECLDATAPGRPWRISNR